MIQKLIYLMQLAIMKLFVENLMKRHRRHSLGHVVEHWEGYQRLEPVFSAISLDYLERHAKVVVGSVLSQHVNQVKKNSSRD